MTEIAVYVEGGGNDRSQKAALRQGFDSLFHQEKSNAREQRMSLTFVCCGGRQEAFEAFKNAMTSNADRINALLVDSEGPIALVPKDKEQDAVIRIAHLRQTQGAGGRGQGDGWEIPNNLAERVHLMVQCMEAWIVADPDALANFYKQEFKRDKLPKRINLEEEPKADICSKLEEASGKTSKGAYGKIKHASKLLAAIDPERVADRCPRFRIFREWLSESIGA